jgi:hypothetical protein
MMNIVQEKVVFNRKEVDSIVNKTKEFYQNKIDSSNKVIIIEMAIILCIGAIAILALLN